MLLRLSARIDVLENTLTQVVSLNEKEGEVNNEVSFKLPNKIPHLKCIFLDKKKQYPKITNYVVTVRLGVMIELRRLSLVFPNMGRGSKFPSNISKTDGGTNLIFTTGATVTPGCETFYGAKYLAHLMRLMIECVEQPMLLINHKTGATIKKINRNLQGLTTFNRFRVVNIVSNGRLTKNYISLAEMEADDDRLDWNPEYFPGLEQVLTREDVPFTQSKKASMTIFDSGKGVGMGVRCTEDCYLAYQYVVNKVLKYPDRKYVPKNSSNRFLYRQEQKRLFNLKSRQKTFDWEKQNDIATAATFAAQLNWKSHSDNLPGVTKTKSKQQQQHGVKKTRKRKLKTLGNNTEELPEKRQRMASSSENVSILDQTNTNSMSSEGDGEGEEDSIETTINQLLFGKSSSNRIMDGDVGTMSGSNMEDEDDEFDRLLDQFDVT